MEYHKFDNKYWFYDSHCSITSLGVSVLMLNKIDIPSLCFGFSRNYRGSEEWMASGDLTFSSVLYQPFVPSVQISLHSDFTPTVPTQQKRQMASSVRQSVSLVNIFPPSNSFWILIRSEKHSGKFAESSFGKMDWTLAAHLNPIRWTESYFHMRSIFVMLWFQLKPNSDAHLEVGT